jgi:hypothetical protein
MSPSSPAKVKQYVRDVAYVPQITPDKGQEHLLRHRVLVELLLKT